FSLFIRTFRWRRMVRTVGEVGYWTVFHSQNVGYLMNNTLPMRAGELLRAVAVARKGDMSITSVLSTVVVERILDFFGLAFTFGLAVAFFPLPDWLQGGGALLSAVVVVLLAVLIVMSRHVERAESVVSRLTSPRGKLVKRIGAVLINLTKGLAVFQSIGQIVYLLLMTIALWIIYIATMQLVMAAFPFTGSMPGPHTWWLPGAVLTVMTTLGLAIPSAPGAVGTYHAAALAGLAMYDIEGGVAVVCATFVHAMMIAVLNLFGVIGLFGLRLSPRDLLKQSKAVEEKPLQEKVKA
ncbi:flippase-like domain-containing protein, partial [bacterium]|nr:flippase-like domain-containing protein [bacterium]